MTKLKIRRHKPRICKWEEEENAQETIDTKRIRKLMPSRRAYNLDNSIIASQKWRVIDCQLLENSNMLPAPFDFGMPQFFSFNKDY